MLHRIVDTVVGGGRFVVGDGVNSHVRHTLQWARGGLFTDAIRTTLPKSAPPTLLTHPTPGSVLRAARCSYGGAGGGSGVSLGKDSEESFTEAATMKAPWDSVEDLKCLSVPFAAAGARACRGVLPTALG